MKALHEMTLTQASKALVSGAVNAVELTQAYLAHIEAAQPHLNAYITINTDAALNDAQRADAQRRDGLPCGPLNGIPMAFKDVIDTDGMPTTCHSKLRSDHISTSDAFAVAKLKQSGVVTLGKLATHEFAFGGPSHDLPFPPARNPWATAHIPGGSSSGSGAAVAAGMCSAALGTDTSGSIRMPAGDCGVVGLKPTFGRVSLRGVYPLSPSMDHVGPMTSTVSDAAMVLEEIAGYDAKDPRSVNFPVPRYLDHLSGDLRGMKIGVLRDWYETRARADVAKALGNAMDVLRDLGALLVEVKAPPLDELNACGRIILLSEGFAVHGKNLRDRPEDFGKFTRMRMQLGAFVTAEDYQRAQIARRRLSIEMTSLFADCEVVLTANQFRPAARFEEADDLFPFLKHPFPTMPFDVTGHPAIAVPCGFSSEGMPIGLQLAARHFDETTLLCAAHAFETALGLTQCRPAFPFPEHPRARPL